MMLEDMYSLKEQVTLEKEGDRTVRACDAESM